MPNAASSFRPRDTALLVLLALIWGNSFLFIKVAVAHVPPPWLVAFRMSIGAALLLPVALLSRHRAPRDPRLLAALAFIGAVGVGTSWSVQAWAQQFLDSGLVAVLNASTPVATLGLAVLVKQERLYANRVLGLALAVAGTLLVVGAEVQAGRSPVALAVAVLATLGYAAAAVITRARISGRVANVWGAALQLVAGALALGPFAYATEQAPPLDLPLPVVLAVLALGALGTGLAFLIFFSLVERVGATNTSMVTYLVPIVALSSGALFRGERFGANVLLGALTMIAGVWLAQRAPRGTPVVATPEA